MQYYKLQPGERLYGIYHVPTPIGPGKYKCFRERDFRKICGLEIEADLFQIRTMKDGWCCPCCCGMKDDFLFISVKIPRESFLSPRIVAKKWKQILSEGLKHRRIIGLVQHVMEIRKTIRVTLNKLLHRKWTRQKFIKAPSYFIMLVVVCGSRMNSFSLHYIWFDFLQQVLRVGVGSFRKQQWKVT